MRRFWMFCLAAVLFPYVFTLAANRGINGIRGSAGMGNMGE